jgi:hypothetical protein
LFARRPDRERAKKLAELGTIRANGSIERSTTPEKGSFERLWAGEDRTFLQLKMGDRESRQLQSGNRAWMLAADSAPKEMPEAKARVALLSGWLLVTGDWRKEFAQAQVLKRIELDGKPAFLVHAGPGSGRQRLIYVDAESGLTLGYDEVVELPGMGMIGRENRFADFRDVEGAQIPFRKTEKYSNPKLGSWTFQVEKIETRVKLDTDPFTIK